MDGGTAPKLDLSITKILEENDDDRVQIIPLTSPMRVRSSLGYQSSYNIREASKDLNAPVELSASVTSIKTIPSPARAPEASTSHDGFRKSSLLSLKSLGMSLRLLKNRGRSDSLENFEPATLQTIDEIEQRKSVFTMDLFERNLKKFTTKSNEADFQSYTDYQQNQSKPKPKAFFKNQKVHIRRSSMSDINDPNQAQNPKLSAQHKLSGISTSNTNVKPETKERQKPRKKDKAADKTAEMLKEVRKRNLETSKRISAPRRTSTAY